MQAVRSLVRSPALQNGLKRAYHDTGNFKPASMNDLPIPCGSWKAHYDAKQTKYNVHFLIGIAFSAVTLVTAKVSGLVYLNYSPPTLD